MMYSSRYTKPYECAYNPWYCPLPKAPMAMAGHCQPFSRPSWTGWKFSQCALHVTGVHRRILRRRWRCAPNLARDVTRISESGRAVRHWCHSVCPSMANQIGSVERDGLGGVGGSLELETVYDWTGADIVNLKRSVCRCGHCNLRRCATRRMYVCRNEILLVFPKFHLEFQISYSCF